MNAEIISADAFQVYQQLNIGTATPNMECLQQVPHHLINIKQPNETYSLHEFLTLTEIAIQQIQQKKKPVIICGGTALFINAFLYEYTLPKAMSQPKLRQQLLERYVEEGGLVLWKELNAIDPESANKIHPNNSHHLVRALELYQLTNQKPSEIKKRKQHSRPDTQIIGLKAKKEVVDQRIEKRINNMLENGWVNEVKQLIEQGITPDHQAFKAIGYKEIFNYIHAKIDYKEMVNCINSVTKKFSKRQMTWFKRIEDVNWQEI